MPKRRGLLLASVYMRMCVLAFESERWWRNVPQQERSWCELRGKQMMPRQEVWNLFWKVSVSHRSLLHTLNDSRPSTHINEERESYRYLRDEKWAALETKVSKLRSIWWRRGTELNPRCQGEKLMEAVCDGKIVVFGSFGSGLARIRKSGDSGVH